MRTIPTNTPVARKRVRARMFRSSRTFTRGPDICPSKYASATAATYFRGVLGAIQGRTKTRTMALRRMRKLLQPALCNCFWRAVKSTGYSAETAAIPIPAAVCAKVFAIKCLQELILFMIRKFISSPVYLFELARTISHPVSNALQAYLPISLRPLSPLQSPVAFRHIRTLYPNDLSYMDVVNDSSSIYSIYRDKWIFFRTRPRMVCILIRRSTSSWSSL